MVAVKTQRTNPGFVVKVGQNGGLSMGNRGKRRVKDDCTVSSLETDVFVPLSERRVTGEGTGLADKEGIKRLVVSSFKIWDVLCNSKWRGQVKGRICKSPT